MMRPKVTAEIRQGLSAAFYEFLAAISSIQEWLDEGDRLWGPQGQKPKASFEVLTAKGAVILGVSAFETFVLKILALRGKEEKGRRSKSLDKYSLAKRWLGVAWELSLDDILGDKRRRDLKFVLCWRHVIIHRADIPNKELVDCAWGAYGEAGVEKWVSDRPMAMEITEARGYVRALRQSAYLIYGKLESYAKEDGTPDVPPPWPRVWIRDGSPDAADPL